MNQRVSINSENKMGKLQFRHIKRLGNILFIGLICYLGVPAILGECSKILSEKIEDESHLERVLNEEKESLGIKKRVIVAKFGKATFGEACCDKLPDGSYEIRLDSWGRYRDAVRHELYHIYAGHLDGDHDKNFHLGKTEFGASCLFVKEPSATLYQVLGIKLDNPEE